MTGKEAFGANKSFSSWREAVVWAVDRRLFRLGMPLCPRSPACNPTAAPAPDRRERRAEIGNLGKRWADRYPVCAQSQITWGNARREANYL
jgi:hypothetical protein